MPHWICTCASNLARTGSPSKLVYAAAANHSYSYYLTPGPPTSIASTNALPRRRRQTWPKLQSWTTSANETPTTTIRLVTTHNRPYFNKVFTLDFISCPVSRPIRAAADPLQNTKLLQTPCPTSPWCRHRLASPRLAYTPIDLDNTLLSSPWASTRYIGCQMCSGCVLDRLA